MTRPTAHFPRILASVAAVLTLFAATLPAQNTQAVVPNRITSPIDESVRVTLHGYIAPQANAANDRGVAPDSMPLERLHLVLKRSPAQEAALQQLVAQMQTPGSANYRKWLTPTQFGQQFGPSDQDIATVESWLSSHGFEVTGVRPGKQVIEFNGNVAQLRDAFHAQIHRYQVNGNIHYATSTEPQIPAALTSVVAGFDSLNDFRPQLNDRVLGTATYNPKTDRSTPNWTYGTPSAFDFVLAPGDFAVQYDLPTSASEQGQGETIAILDFSNVNMDLVKQFRTMFGLPTNNLPQVIVDGNDPGVDGINNPDGPYLGSSGESYLDLEWAGAVAPQATIDLVVAADTALENGGLLAAEDAVYSDLAPIISSSIDVGGCEQTAGSLNAFMSSLWEEAAAQGQTVIVAAGDSGSAGCDNDNTEEYAVSGLGVNSWASTPYNVAVGGTDFYYSDYASGAESALSDWKTTPTQAPGTSLLKPLPEQPWNNSQYGLDAVNVDSDNGTNIVGGSGGASSSAVCANSDWDASTGACDSTLSGYPKPSWQTGTGTQSDKVRDIPDVSLFAADGVNYSYYPMCATDGDCQTPSGSNLYQITAVGGTSVAAPAFAGIMALVDQKYGPQGQADFVLYPLKTQFPAAFHDIVNGTNSVPCESGTYNCIPVTGGLTVGGVLEGQLGTGATPDYKAAAGYNLATGLGSVDASVLLNDWGNVSFKTTSVTLTPSETSFTHGTSITVSGSVTGSTTPTGSVALLTDSTEPYNQGETSFALSSGSYSASINYLPGGTYDIWGQYSGDGTNAASTSAKTSITVSPEASDIFFYLLNSATSITDYTAISSGESVPYGTQLILDAEPVPASYYKTCNVSSPPASCSTATFSAPTGTVAFKDSGATVSTAVLNTEGDAETNYAFPVGNHSVTSSYSGDNSYQASTAAATTFTVTQASPAIYLSASNQPSSSALSFVGGQATVFNIQIENTSNSTTEEYGIGSAVPVLPPTGTVTVTGLPGGTQTATLASAVDPGDYFVEGVATVTLPANAAAGNYSVGISYGGDKNYAAVSGTGTITITAATSGLLASTTAATMAGSVSPNSSITVTGTVTGQSGHAAPTGYVTFFSSGYALGSLAFTSSSGDVSTFAVTLDSQDLFQGANFVTIQYSGDTNYNPSNVTLNSGTAISSPRSDFSMVPNSPNVPVNAGSSAMDTIQLASINGFSGSVTYTCTAASGVTCSVSPTSTAFTANGTSTTTVTVNANSSTASGNYNVQVEGQDSTGEYIHTIGLTAIVAGSTSTTPGFSLTNSASIPVAPGGTGMSTLTVAPTNGFTGGVNFTCAIGGTPAGLSCAAPSTTISGTTSATSTLTATATSAAAAGNYTATVTATDAATGTITASTTVSITVTSTVTGSFALTNSGNISVTAGDSGPSTISVTPSGGFTGNVALSCAVTTTSGPGGVTCSLGTSPVDITGTAALTSKLTVTTTSSSAAVRFPMTKFLTGAGGVMLAFVVFFGIPARRKSWHTILGLLVVIVVAAGMGCGSSGGGGGGGSPQSATYTVTVTGTSGNTSTTTAVTVTVTSN